MFYIVTGKKGGGKSLYQVRQLLIELQATERNIVTNLPLHLEEIQDEMIERGWKGHVLDRITILEPEQTREFYLYRGNDVHRVPMVVKKQANPDVPLDFEASANDPICGRGVAYFLDELALIYPKAGSSISRKIPEELLFYSIQERKLMDDTWGAAQILTMVNKDYRDLQQEYHYVRNLSKEKFGHFKRGDFFEVSKFYYPKTKGDEPEVEREKFKLEVKRIARCYNTAGGIGIPLTAQADKNAKKVKGLPMWTIWAGLAAVMVVGWYAVGYTPRLISWFVLGKKTASAPGPIAPGLLGTKVSEAAGVHVASAPSSPVPLAEPVPVRKEDAPLVRSKTRVRGYAVRGGIANVVLSDGSIATEMDSVVSRVDRVSVVVNGERLFMVPAVDHAPAPRLAPVAEETKPVDAAQADEPDRSESTWRLDPDGVQRLRHPDTLQTLVRSGR